MKTFIVARNPNRASGLPFLVRVPLATGDLWLKTKDSWPRTGRVYCHPLDVPPGDIEIISETPIVVCQKRRLAIDLVLERGLNKRSQFVKVHWHGRDMIFWQTAKTARSSRPGIRVPAGHASHKCVFFIDSRERWGYTFSAYGATTERRKLSVGDYAAILDDRVVAVVERKTLSDFSNAVVDGSLNFTMTELCAVPHAAVVIEGDYSQVLRNDQVRKGFLPVVVARLQVRYREIPMVFLESRKIAEEWCYQFLSAAYDDDEAQLAFRLSKKDAINRT